MKAKQNAVAAQGAKQATTNGTVKMLVHKDQSGKQEKPAEPKPQATPAAVVYKNEAVSGTAVTPAKPETSGTDQPQRPQNLQTTLKVVDTLHRRVIQRTNLINMIDTLESFLIKQVEDENGGEFVGCELTIKDDERHSWSTKNTNLIAAVIEFTKQSAATKLAEIEAGIILPAA